MSTEIPAGHSVLAFPVPELDAWVRDRTRHYDASFVSADPAFVHAHITVLGPWLASPGPDDLGRVAEVLAETEPIDVTLGAVHAFPDGLLHLRPVPEDPIRDLTARLTQEFPDHPPYGGAYPDPTPHLTLDQVSTGSAAGDPVTAHTVSQRLGETLPVTVRLDRLDLQWWANHDCRLLHSWWLGEQPEQPEQAS
ncbi:2'-5' RNA ligase family protein [Nocardioides sp. BP30]|uniref:2'-5' RNA ligase family protein n=1 Tax=Nocardioides sp. BP30 TaxID=3036374 RepID=UPI002468DFB4|nr:2'-5' RNA ligase family protein [Nocardioides sp. BP30]WGL51263.1 2'-5' RNA ligase family protein [Nocardioides sp. BP30]